MYNSAQQTKCNVLINIKAQRIYLFQFACCCCRCFWCGSSLSSSSLFSYSRYHRNKHEPIVYGNHMHGRTERLMLNEQRKVWKGRAFPVYTHVHIPWQWAALRVAVSLWIYEWDMGGQDLYKTSQKKTGIFLSAHTNPHTRVRKQTHIHRHRHRFYLDSLNATACTTIRQLIFSFRLHIQIHSLVLGMCCICIYLYCMVQYISAYN